MLDSRHTLNRRALLARGLAGSGLLLAPRLAFASAATDRRFVLIILRGAMDGLNVAIPYADPDYARLRGALAIEGQKLDGTWALHPALVRTAQLVAARQAAFVHAVASPYRERSHFDGQNVLESGGTAAYALKTGWLNRLVAALPRGPDAIAFAPAVPLALRGPAPTTSFAPGGFASPRADLMGRVGALYEADPLLHPLWDAALAARGLAAEAAPDGAKPRGDPAGLGRIAATFLARPDGPRIATIEINGWDTHAAQNNRLDAALRNLDATVAALADGLGAAWANTLVLAATEFGRTAAANGTGGTDHGTGGAALLAGGALAAGQLAKWGGSVHADWPGLSPSALLDNRDLRPTTDLRALILALAAGHFGLEPARLSPLLFPSGGVRPATLV